MGQNALNFDAAGGRGGRDAGIALVSGNNEDWMSSALALLPAFFASWCDLRDPLSEDWRAWMVSRGLPEPANPNAWGALTMIAQKRGLVAKTGEWRQMQLVPSHGRMTPAYRWAGGDGPADAVSNN